MTRYVLIAAAVLLSAGLVVRAADEPKKAWPKPPEMKIDVNKKYVATMDTTAGKIVLELDPKVAPNTVNSFVFLSREKFYEGTIFHRVIKGFMIQGGDPTGTGTGGPGYNLKAEFNDTKHVRGVISMARAQDPDSAGSQFFIMHGDNAGLDGKYTAFGKVIDGLDTLDKIATAPVERARGGESSKPVDPVKIKTITIEEK